MCISRRDGLLRRLVSPLQMEMAYLPPQRIKAAKRVMGALVHSSSTPFIICKGLHSIPAKLVMKIQKGALVDMAEHLRDNYVT